MKPTTIDQYLELLDLKQKEYASKLRQLVNQTVPEVQEMIFVSHPAYYIPVEGVTSYHRLPMIMMIFFKDHVNIFAEGNAFFKDELKDYKMTQKNTLQVYFDKSINVELFKRLFEKSFHK
ncbi:MAG: DUF1801 domain-containing protein [Firmicutes bacterium]|nr:DUF1801 domain-containing protein [Bacillota bacterium]